MARKEALWLGRYRDLLPVRSRGAFHVLSVVRDADTNPSDARSIVVVGSRGTERTAVGEALSRVAGAHGLIRHARIPALVEHGEHDGTPFVELDCDAIMDGAEFLRLLADAGQKLSYGQGDALFTSLRQAMRAAHAVLDPATGRPYCFGRVGYASFLFARSGRFWVVGPGHNFPLVKEDGRLEGHGPVFQAPEVLASDSFSPSGDYVAVLMAARSLMAFCDVADVARTVLSLAGSAEAAATFEAARWFETRFISERPENRPSIDEGIAQSERLRQLVGVTLDVAGLESRAAAIIAQADGEPRPEADGTTLSVAHDGSWIETGSGERRKLGAANQQILRTLLLAYRHEPARAIGVWQLLEAGWPGDEPIPEAGANRVYVAIARLRALGLRHMLERHGDGYRIAPGAALKIAGEPPP